jgi:hypothetical protein
MEFLTIFIVVVAFIAIALILMSVNILIKKNGKFSNEHIGQSKALKKRGIKCAQTQDREEQKRK